MGCEPLDNAEEIGGNIAFISRGDCAFVLKAQHAAEAGAEAVVVYNNVPDNPTPDGLVYMGGDCSDEVCSAPAVFVSYNSGQALLSEVQHGADALLDPVFDRPCGDPVFPMHNTGVVQFEVFEYGYFGAFADFSGSGFVFEDNPSALFVGTVLIGVDGNVSNNPYAGAPEFMSESPVEAITPPAPFDQAFLTVFSSEELGVRVTEHSYSRAGDPYVVVELEVENVSGSDIEDAYVGILADWDVMDDEDDTSQNDFGGVNENLNVPYVYDADMDQYYGVAVWGGGNSLSGYSLDATTADDAQLWEALTTDVEPADGPAERVAVTGTGPYDLAAGTSVTVWFAFVGGASEAEFFANATPPLMPDAEPSAPAEGFTLAPIYPNPASSQATLSLTLPAAQNVSVAVYDVLGREVAVLHDGPLAVGVHRIVLDAAELPAGLYLVRAEGANAPCRNW